MGRAEPGTSNATWMPSSPQLGHLRRLAMRAKGKSRPLVQTNVCMSKAVSKPQGSILTMPRWSPRLHLMRMPHLALYASPKV